MGLGLGKERGSARVRVSFRVRVIGTTGLLYR